MTTFKTVRQSLLVFLTHQVALPILKVVRNPKLFPYTQEELAHLPEGTLGHDLHLFLHRRNLKLLPYYARHDLKHILLQYDTSEEGEACLQAFMLANGRVSFPVLATVVYAFLTMPEYWKSMRAAYRRGKQCRSIHTMNWYASLQHSTQQLRNHLQIPQF